MEDELEKNIHKIKKSADIVYETKDYTSATILYFKTIFALLDLTIYKNKGITPKDHTERFRLLKKEIPEEYKLLDSEFNTYKSTYSRIISKETCERIKKIIEDEINKYKIK